MSRMDVIQAATDAAIDRTGTADLLAGLRAIAAMRADLGHGMKPTIFDHILRHPGCTIADLIAVVYPNPDAEPESAEYSIQQTVAEIRRRLAPHGHTVDACSQHGRYHLRKLTTHTAGLSSRSGGQRGVATPPPGDPAHPIRRVPVGAGSHCPRRASTDGGSHDPLIIADDQPIAHRGTASTPRCFHPLSGGDRARCDSFADLTGQLPTCRHLSAAAQCTEATHGIPEIGRKPQAALTHTLPTAGTPAPRGALPVNSPARRCWAGLSGGAR